MFFGFWLLRAIGRGMSRGASAAGSRGVPKAAVRPTPCHPFAVFLMVAIGAVSLCVMMATGLSNGLLTFDIISISVIGLIGMLVPSSAENKAVMRQLDQLPAPGDDPGEARDKTAQMRQRASDLRGGTATLERPAETQEAGFRVPRVQSVSQSLSEQAEAERLMRVAAILVAPCPACGAGEAEFCLYTDDERVTLLDRERSIVAHDKRIGNAVKLGIAKVEDVTAQFEGSVPDSVWEAAL